MMLIDKIEIGRHREVSRGVKDDKLNPFISDAELLDLKPLLGSALYFDLVKNKADAKYVDLMDGKEFTVNGITYSFTGLKKILSLFAYARYIMFGSYTDTAFGFVEKSNQDAQPVTAESKKIIYTENKKIAYQYFNDVKVFLDNNTEDYPLWNTGCKTKRTGSGFNISKIS